MMESQYVNIMEGRTMIGSDAMVRSLPIIVGMGDLSQFWWLCDVEACFPLHSSSSFAEEMVAMRGRDRWPKKELDHKGKITTSNTNLPFMVKPVFLTGFHKRCMKK